MIEAGLEPRPCRVSSLNLCMLLPPKSVLPSFGSPLGLMCPWDEFPGEPQAAAGSSSLGGGWGGGGEGCEGCGREDHVSGGAGGSSPRKGQFLGLRGAWLLGRLPVNGEERPVRLQDKWGTYGLQISTQWAHYFASASNEITLYYCRRHRINKHSIWVWVLRSFYLCPPFSWGSWSLWDH